MFMAVIIFMLTGFVAFVKRRKRGVGVF